MTEEWAARLTQAVSGYLATFEARFGFPPDEHWVKAGTGRSGADLAAAVAPAEVPTDLVRFFDAVEEVSLADVWNGYFLGPATRTLSAYKAEEPRWLDGPAGRTEVLVMGSDGGGSLYVVRAAASSEVLRLCDVAVADGVATPRTGGEVTVVGDSLDDFLARFVKAVEALAARDAEPPF